MSREDEPNQNIWKFEHSVECPVSRDFAWQFWTNLANWPVVDPSVESVKLDGPFAAGARGITKPRDLPPVEWQITEVQDRSIARIEIPAPGAVLKCFWRFEDSTTAGVRITETVSMEGEQAAEYVEKVGPELESGIPQAMRRLAEEMTRAANKQSGK
jgi:uncharacterized membrane protein